MFEPGKYRFSTVITKENLYTDFTFHEINVQSIRDVITCLLYHIFMQMKVTNAEVIEFKSNSFEFF